MLNQEGISRKVFFPACTSKQNHLIVMFPLYFIQFYLTFTVFVFAFGPWPWPVSEPIVLYLFLLSAQLALWLGYKCGLNERQNRYYGQIKIGTLIKIGIVVNFVCIVPNYVLRMGMQELNVEAIMSAVISGFLDPAAMYVSKIEAIATMEKTPLIGYISIILSPLQWLLFPLGIVYWSKMSRSNKVVFACLVVLDLLTWIATGTNKGIADFIILLPSLLLASRPEIIVKITWKKIMKLIIALSIGFVLLFGFFYSGQKGRGGGEIPTYSQSINIDIDETNWMIYSLPPDAKSAVGAFTSYLVQGYFALSLALLEPFDFSYGVGNSYYLTGIAERHFGGVAVSDRTFPAKIEKHGWDRYSEWHSIYTWIASDVTFPGAILVVLLIGRLFALVWLDVLRKENPYAVVLYALLIIMLFYFPANNQVLAFSGTAIPFFTMFACWVFTRKRFVW